MAQIHIEELHRGEDGSVSGMTNTEPPFLHKEGNSDNNVCRFKL